MQAKNAVDAVFFAAYGGCMNTLTTPRDILNYVGKEAAAAALGVTLDRVDRAQRDALLPAAWLDTLERLARRPLDRGAFAFKRAEDAA